MKKIIIGILIVGLFSGCFEEPKPLENKPLDVVEWINNYYPEARNIEVYLDKGDMFTYEYTVYLTQNNIRYKFFLYEDGSTSLELEKTLTHKWKDSESKG